MADVGRPCEFTPEIGEEICIRLALGQSVREIVRDDEMPSERTVYRWLLRDDMQEFRQQYARAHEFQADSCMAETKEIADDGRNDWMEKFGKDGESIGWQINGEAVQRSKLRFEERKWRASKLAPKKYGEKTLLGSDPENPLPASPGLDVSKLPTEVLEAVLAAKNATQPE